jgi:hypothetical protein
MSSLTPIRRRTLKDIINRPNLQDNAVEPYNHQPYGINQWHVNLVMLTVMYYDMKVSRLLVCFNTANIQTGGLPLRILCNTNKPEYIINTNIYMDKR